MEDPTIPRSPNGIAPTNLGVRALDWRVPPAARERLSWLRSRHPFALVWYGNTTCRWWAVAGGRLVEALDPAELDQALRTPAVWPWPRAAGR